jgi:thiol-disulfide isomerase/thioredoxin
MDIRKIVLLGSGLLIGAALGLWILWGGPFKADSASRKMPEIGLQSSDFSLEDLSGKQITLSSLQGKAVILNFWATWCPPCKEEMPLLQDYARRYPDRLVVVGVAKSQLYDIRFYLREDQNEIQDHNLAVHCHYL